MANPFYNALGGAKNPQGGQRNLAPNLIRYIQGFQGNPIQQIQSKLSSGEMTQEQYNQLHGMAENIVQRMMSILPHK